MSDKDIDKILDQNRAWVSSKTNDDSSFFSSRAEGQSPVFLWLGCADSRVPPNLILGLEPGDVFVHRNIANVLPTDDVNSGSVIAYAVGALGVKHVLVTGHTRCGGVLAAMDDASYGALDPWLANIKAVAASHKDELDAFTDEAERANRLVALNVEQQVANVCEHEAVKAAWSEGRSLQVHGLVYELETGLLRDLGITRSGS